MLRKLWNWIRARHYDNDLTVGEMWDAHFIRPEWQQPRSDWDLRTIVVEMREWGQGDGCFNDNPEGEPIPCVYWAQKPFLALCDRLDEAISANDAKWAAALHGMTTAASNNGKRAECAEQKLCERARFSDTDGEPMNAAAREFCRRNGDAS